jgi:hydroxymethylbilane synthase
VGSRKVIKLGSRGSALALRQSEEVLGQLRALHPDLEFQVTEVRTRGDINAQAPLAGMGLGVFVKELERELLDGRVDLAVHSLKDLPTGIPPELALGALPRRQDPRDVLVNRWHCSLDQLPQGAHIGTSSPRRRALLKSLCPQVTVVPIRGNVETRLRKARGEECDGAVLAAAGLVRLGLTEHVAEYLSPQQFVPPPGQGTLAVEARAGDDWMLELLRTLDHAETREAVTAERAFLELLGGGCQLPAGAYARREGDSLLMSVFLGSPEGERAFRAEAEGTTHDSAKLAGDAYQSLLQQGAGELLEEHGAFRG